MNQRMRLSIAAVVLFSFVWIQTASAVCAVNFQKEPSYVTRGLVRDMDMLKELSKSGFGITIEVFSREIEVETDSGTQKKKNFVYLANIHSDERSESVQSSLDRMAAESGSTLVGRDFLQLIEQFDNVSDARLPRLAVRYEDGLDAYESKQRERRQYVQGQRKMKLEMLGKHAGFAGLMSFVTFAGSIFIVAPLHESERIWGMFITAVVGGVVGWNLEQPLPWKRLKTDLRHSDDLINTMEDRDSWLFLNGFSEAPQRPKALRRDLSILGFHQIGSVSDGVFFPIVD